MADNTLKFPRGSVITFTSGEYSDFGLNGFLVATTDLDLPALAKEFVVSEGAAIAARGEDWNTPSPDDFPAWLVARGHAMPCANTAVHLGAYGCWESEFGIES